MVRNKEDLERSIKNNSNLLQIYEKNKNWWLAYWEENKKSLRIIAEILNKKLHNFNLSSFNACAKFFGAKLPEKYNP